MKVMMKPITVLLVTLMLQPVYHALMIPSPSLMVPALLLKEVMMKVMIKVTMNQNYPDSVENAITPMLVQDALRATDANLPVELVPLVSASSPKHAMLMESSAEPRPSQPPDSPPSPSPPPSERSDLNLTPIARRNDL